MIKATLFTAQLCVATLSIAELLPRKEVQGVSPWEALADKEGDVITDANGEIVYVLSA